MRYDSDHKQKTRAKVLDAAARTIRDLGPDRVGVASVMAEAGLTHGGFYAHFTSKSELVAAAIGRMFEQAQDRFAHETAEKQPRQALSAYVDFYLSKRHRDARDMGCPIAALSSDLPRMDEQARGTFMKGVQGLTDRIAGLLGRVGNSDGAALARSLLAEMVGVLTLARAEPRTKQSDELLRTSRAMLKRRFSLEEV